MNARSRPGVPLIPPNRPAGAPLAPLVAAADLDQLAAHDRPDPAWSRAAENAARKRRNR